MLKGKAENDERELILALRNGRAPAFRTLYEEYGPRLYTFCKKFGLSSEEGREVVQETFIRVWENRQELRTDLSFSSYLFTIARNLIYNDFRRTAYWEKYLHDAGVRQAASTPSLPTVDERELQRLIGEAVLKLPDKCRQVFWKSRYEGRSNQQIADELSISKSTVENQLNKALKNIRAFLEKNGYDPATLSAYGGMWYILINFICK